MKPSAGMAALKVMPSGISGISTMAWCGALLVMLLAWVRLGPELQALYHAAANPLAAEIAGVQLFNLRLPRVLAALLAGAALGLSGTLFQSLTRNPVAAPDILGVTTGAQLGLLAALFLPFLGGQASPPLFFVFGLGAAALVGFAAGGPRATPLRLILAGSACALFFSSIITLLLALFEQNIAGVALWSGGALYQPGANGLVMAALWLLLPLCILPWVVRSLEIHALGDDPARTLGVALNRTRLLTLICAVGCAAVAVSIAGPVGFVGLLAPNLLRAAGTYRLRRLLPLSALWGAVLLLAADTLMILVDSDGKLLLGVVVALAGTPLLMVLIHRSQQLHLPEQPDKAHGNSLVLSLRASIIVLFAVLTSLFFIGMWAGLEPLSPARWLAAFAGADPVAGILLDLRIPRMLVAAVGGALLAASGALLQSVVRNPLAGPELLGLTQGAGLFTLAGLIVWPTISRLGMFGMALTGSVTVLVLILSLNRRHHLAPLPVALTGLALGALCAALSQWLIVHYSIQPAQSLVWLAGATYGRSWDDVLALLPWLALCLPLFVLLARPLDLLALGDQTAAALGVGIGALRTLALALATLVAGAVVAVIGPVAFVGLITPHIARSMGFHMHRQLLPVAMLLGAVMLVLADLLGRTLLAPREVPAGVLTALFGAPYFLLLMVWRERGVRRLS